MKPIVFSLIVFSQFSVLAFKLKSQNPYRFESSTGAYQELSTAKRISFSLMDQLNGFYRLDELKGETFKWYNTLFTIDTIKTFHIQPYANFRFDNDSALIILDGGFTYLDSIDDNSSISYSIDGQPGDKVVKAQYKNLHVRVGQSGNFMNVQIWMYQKSGIMEIHFGASSSSNGSGFNVNTGPQVGIFFSKDDFTACYSKLWVTGSPASIKLDSNTNYTFKAMSGLPVEGTIYRFVPRFPSLRIEDETNTSFTFYPNPITGDFLYLSRVGSYQIFDAVGQLVRKAADSQYIQVTGLTAGIYYLESESQFYKFVIER